MSWALVLLLALGAFALAAFAFRLERRLWTTLLAALVFGLAGYAMQASPQLPGAPRQAGDTGEQVQWGSVEARKEMLSAGEQSTSDRLLIGDALARRGQFANAAIMLRGALEQDPTDGEAWLALANVLVEHAEGSLTPAALYAYRQASEHTPGSAAPGYFLGLALIRQGRIPEARQAWQATLATAQDGAPRALLAERAGRLDALLAQAGMPMSGPESPATTAP